MPIDATHQATLDDLQAHFSAVGHLPGVVYRSTAVPPYHAVWMVGQVEQLTGYRAEAFAEGGSMSFADIVHPDDVDETINAIVLAISRGESWDVEYRVIHAKGATRYARGFGGAVMGPDGAIQYLEGVIIDISERRLEQLGQLEAAAALARRNAAMADGVERIIETLQNIDILSINASIEAARAGSTGRGFAVVAEEMKRLTADAEGSVTDIRELIAVRDRPPPAPQAKAPP